MRRRVVAVTMALAVSASCTVDASTGTGLPPSESTPLAVPVPRELWRWDVPAGSSAGMPAVATDGSGEVAFTFGRHVLVLLNGRQPIWQAELVGLRDVAPLITPAAVVAATDYGLAAFDRLDGSLLWHSLLGDWASTPVSVAGRFVVALWDGALVAIDPIDGSPAWRVGLGGRALAPPSVAMALESVVVSWDSDGRAGVTSASVPDGRVRWTAPVAPFGVSGAAVVPGSPGSDPVVMLVAGDRRAHALSAADGEHRWSLPLEGAGSPEVVPGMGPEPGEAVVGHRLGGFAVLGVADGAWLWGSTSDEAAVRGSPVAAGDPAGSGPAVAMPLDDGRVLVATPRGRAELRLTPGRLSGVALDRQGSLVVAGRGPGPAFVAAVAGWAEAGLLAG